MYRERVSREKLLEVLAGGPLEGCKVSDDEQMQRRFKEAKEHVETEGRGRDATLSQKNASCKTIARRFCETLRRVLARKDSLGAS